MRFENNPFHHPASRGEKNELSRHNRLAKKLRWLREGGREAPYPLFLILPWRRRSGGYVTHSEKEKRQTRGREVSYHCKRELDGMNGDMASSHDHGVLLLKMAQSWLSCRTHNTFVKRCHERRE